jgi:ribosomal-protein-alanine N-acetyltransferase
MIRALNPIDASMMAKIHASNFQSAWPETDMLEHIHRDITVGFGRKLRGFIILRSAQDQAEILTLAVSKPYQRQGIAKALMSAAEVRVIDSGTELLFLEVAEDNAPALGLYAAMGYEKIGRRPAYYRRSDGRVAALIFRKRLDA